VDICGVQQAANSLCSRRPSNRPEIATSHTEARVPGQRKGLGAVTSLGLQARARQARALSGRSPPGGEQRRWKTARPTTGLTATILSAVRGGFELPPQPLSAGKRSRQQTATRCTSPKIRRRHRGLSHRPCKRACSGTLTLRQALRLELAYKRARTAERAAASREARRRLLTMRRIRRVGTLQVSGRPFLAMQKVVRSNPIIRSQKAPLDRVFVASTGIVSSSRWSAERS
jgi:hypothetical protein